MPEESSDFDYDTITSQSYITGHSPPKAVTEITMPVLKVELTQNCLVNICMRKHRNKMAFEEHNLKQDFKNS
jgi:hypothetical protein